MIITLASFKGGVGKTTTAIHLCQYFATRKPKLKVVLADGDPNRTAIDWEESSQFDLPFAVVDASEDLPKYDVLVVDTPARTEPDELADLIETSTLVIIPTKVDIFDVRATLALGDALRPYPHKCRILLTGLPRGKRLYESAKQLFDEQGLKSFDGGIQQLAVYRDAAYEGVPVGRYNEAGKKAMADYEKIGAQILKGWKNG
ncbi:MAG: ParA family protein [Leptolyngbya sp. Prado105]|jgi:chromosome partitioning protein|nr:ParA family protein [Leptolyngbya sp. Prado105]